MSLTQLRSTAKTLEGVIIGGVLLRLALFALPELSNTLQRRPELATPLTSFRSLKEAVYIYEKGSNPYSGGIFYHSPLYLALFTVFLARSEITTALIWTIADIQGALALVNIWRRRSLGSGHSRHALIAALYLFNPYTLLSCIAKSTTSLDNTLVLLSLSYAATAEAIPSLALLAIATHTSLYPLLLLPPILMLLANGMSNTRSRVIQHLCTFITISSGLAALNCALVGISWLQRTWGVIVNVSDLAPNVGMWWYFFTEMFEHFRLFFLGVFQLHVLIYVAPLCLRLKDDPLFVALIMMGIFGTWKSYPTLGDTALWAGLLGCFPEITSNLRHPLFTLTVHLYTSILLPLLHSLWLLTGTGNANFFYAATMVYGLNASLAIVDVLGAGLRYRVKQQVREALLYDEMGSKETTSSWSSNIAALNRIWENKGWAVVQFTGQTI